MYIRSMSLESTIAAAIREGRGLCRLDAGRVVDMVVHEWAPEWGASVARSAYILYGACVAVGWRDLSVPERPPLCVLATTAGYGDSLMTRDRLGMALGALGLPGFRGVWRETADQRMRRLWLAIRATAPREQWLTQAEVRRWDDLDLTRVYGVDPVAKVRVMGMDWCEELNTGSQYSCVFGLWSSEQRERMEALRMEWSRWSSHGWGFLLPSATQSRLEAIRRWRTSDGGDPRQFDVEAKP